MRIIVNDVVATPESGGVFSVLSDFYSQVLNSEDQNEWFFLLSDRYFATSERVHIITLPLLKKSRISRLFFEFLVGRYYINSLSPDLYLVLQNAATLGVKSRQMVYLQQTLFFFRDTKKFSFFKANERKYAVYQSIIGRIFNILNKRSDSQLIVQTKWLKNILIKQQIKDSKDIIVAEPFLEGVDRAVKDVGNTFFYPAGPHVYKDHQALVYAVRKLVQSGIDDFEVVVTLTKRQLENVILGPIPEHIHTVGSISREAVYEYFKSSVLVFPSLIESYGLPLLEARTIGTKIITSNIGPAHEILKNYPNVDYFSAGNSDGLEALMRKWILSDHTVRTEQPHQNQDNTANLLQIVLGG